MFENSKVFSGFSSDDLDAAQTFYGDTLGLNVSRNEMGMLVLTFSETYKVIIYPKPNHVPAEFTVLNFPVDDIDKSVSDLQAKGVTFEHYEGLTDDTGVARGKSVNRGPDIAWFKDPAGNILSVLCN